MEKVEQPGWAFRFLIPGAGLAVLFLIIILVVVILPQMTFRPRPSAYAHQYTSLELRGREIYKREGCWYCHTQFTRPQDRDLGPLVMAGDYVYDEYHLLGSERTGPDLSNIGGKYTNRWHRAHHTDPRSVFPGSIMPSFSYLTRRKVHLTGEELAQLKALGTDLEQEHRQPDEMDALIVYLQGLGAKRMPSLTDNPHPEVPQRFVDIAERLKKEQKIHELEGVEPRFVINGRGLYQAFCLQCHGDQGYGDGSVAYIMTKRPANFHEEKFKQYTDAMWLWRISEGVPGTRMPVWELTLSEEQRGYLVTYVKFLASGKTIQELQEQAAKE